MTTKKPSPKQERGEFEKLVGGLLKVDPAGLSGKHKAEKKPAKAEGAKKAPAK